MDGKKLADKMNVSPAFISAIEHHSSNISLDNLEKLCQAFDISISNFFSEEMDPIDLQLLQCMKQLSHKEKEYLHAFILSLLKKK